MGDVGRLDRRHEEVVGGLDGVAEKLAAVRLLEYLKGLPPVVGNPQALFYHVNALRRLCCLILEPAPFSTHPRLLHDLLTALLEAGDSPVARRVGALAEARTRLGLLLCAEHGIRADWEEALEAARGAGISLPDAPDSDEVRRAEELLDVLRTHPSAGGMLWPYHFLDPGSLPADSVLGVLVDGDDIPAPYREAYVCTVGTELKLTRRREAPEPVVRARDDRGEDLPLSDELKDLVREAVGRSFVLLGPVAQRKLHQVRVEIDVSIRRPTIVTQLAGRSILLPLILSLSRTLARSLNLAGVPMPAGGVVWTGDVDEHGGVRHVRDIAEKTRRVLASRADCFAYPAEDDESVEHAVGAVDSARDIERLPVAHVQDCIGDPALMAIRSRSPMARAAYAVRQKAKPLGIAGIAATAAVLFAIGFVIPRLASWLDTTPVEARFTSDDHDHIELVNSRGRTLSRFPIVPTTTENPLLVDPGHGGAPQILYGTSVGDSLPGTLFCLNTDGGEIWRFEGGFREDEAKPYDYKDTFGTCGAMAADLDGDGRSEVIATFSHNPWFPFQVALLSANGSYVSSFWNRGSLWAGNFTHNRHAFINRDTDQDGYTEILVGGTNNGCNQAVLVVLDPRSIKGKGPECGADSIVPTWQSYVVLPDCPELRQATKTPRFHVKGIQTLEWHGKPAIRLNVSGALPEENLEGFFAYVLDLNLDLIDFYYADTFAMWVKKARAEGKLPPDFDLSSPEFQARMRQIEVIPGPPELLQP
jgi:hypothetical protein